MFVDSKLRTHDKSELQSAQLSLQLETLHQAIALYNAESEQKAPSKVRLDKPVRSFIETEDVDKRELAEAMSNLAPMAAAGSSSNKEERFLGLIEDDFRELLSKYITLTLLPRQELSERRLLRSIIQKCRSEEITDVASLLAKLDEEITTRSGEAVNDDEQKTGEMPAESYISDFDSDLVEGFDFNDVNTWDDVLDSNVRMRELHAVMRD